MAKKERVYHRIQFEEGGKLYTGSYTVEGGMICVHPDFPTVGSHSTTMRVPNDEAVAIMLLQEAAGLLHR